MPVNHTANVRDQMADMVVDLIDVGAGPGTLEMQTATGFEVVTSQFSKPAFADAANGIAIAAPIESGISESGGTIALAVARDSEGSEVISMQRHCCRWWWQY